VGTLGFSIVPYIDLMDVDNASDDSHLTTLESGRYANPSLPLKSDIIEATQCLRMWLILDRKREGKWKGKGNWVTPKEIYIFDGVMMEVLNSFTVS
jgi:hypothetical protein